MNEFISKSISLWGDKYDYSLVDYINSKTKVKIIYDGVVYEQTPNKHLSGRAPERNQQDDRNSFVCKSKMVHGDKYDYSLVDYVNSKTKVKIIYDDVVYEQTPNSHLLGRCPEKLNTRKSVDTFIEDAIRIHGDKYDYSLVEYKNNRTNVKIGYNGVVYEQSPAKHLSGNCPENEFKVKMVSEQFMNRCIAVHGDKYDYSLVEYNGFDSVVKIVYKGVIYEQLASTHLSGYCPEMRNNRKSVNEFIRESVNVHGDTYDYSLVDYKNNKIKVDIICPEHGIFKQSPSAHIRGNGCPMCVISKGNLHISRYLISKGIIFETEKRFSNCKNKKVLPFDFFVPSMNILIEFDGRQHYESIDYFGGEPALNLRRINDGIKDAFAKDNGFKLIRIRYDDDIDEILDIYI